MKIPDFFKRQAPSKPVPPQKKLKATARRAALPLEESYDDDEPNVRLSRAFLVVMLLHVVAVGGIFAFSSLKKDGASTATVTEGKSADPAPGVDMPADSRSYVVGSGESLGTIASAFGLTLNDLQSANQLAAGTTVKEGDKLIIPAKSAAQPVPLDVQKLLKLSQKPEPLPAAKNVESSVTSPVAPAASGKFYVVQKGDNPVVIAKHLKVKYADLISVNKITDPRKLQIGQKLIIPE